jgi:hypothetical protein
MKNRVPRWKLPSEVWVIFSIALLFRLAFFFHHRADGFHLEYDASLYLALAEGLKHGMFTMFHPLDIPETTRMPGYPWLIHMLGSVPVVLLVQVLISAFKIPLVWSLGTRLGLRGRMALLPPLLIALEPVDIILSGSVLTETLFGTLLIAGLVLLLTMKAAPGALGAALCFAAAAWLRPNGLHLALVIGAFLLVACKEPKRLVLLFTSVTLLMLLPWMIRNYLIDGRMHLSDSGTVVAAHLHVPEVLTHVDPEAAHRYRQELHTLGQTTNWTDPVEMRTYFSTLGAWTGSVLVSNWSTWIMIQLKKTATILLAPGRGYLSRHFKDARPMLVILTGISLCYTMLLVASGLLALIQSLKSDWRYWTLLVATAFILFSNAISAPDARLKNPVLPLIVLLGMHAIQQRMMHSSGRTAQWWLVSPGNGPASRSA